MCPRFAVACPRFAVSGRRLDCCRFPIGGEVFSHERIEGGLHVVNLAVPFVDIARHGDKALVWIDFDSLVPASALDVGASEDVQSSSALRYFRVAAESGDNARRPRFFLAAV